MSKHRKPSEEAKTSAGEPIHTPDFENPPIGEEGQPLQFIPFPIFDDLDTPGADYKAMEQLREASRDLMGDTRRMREAALADKWLPRWKGKTTKETESDFQFERRVEIALLTNYYGSLIRSTIDQSYSKPLDLSEFQPELIELSKHIAEDGSGFDAYTRLASENSLSEIISHTLIDMPPRTQENERDPDTDMRLPFWLNIPAFEMIDVDGIQSEQGRTRIQTARRKFRVSVEQKRAHNEQLEDRVQIFHRGDPDLAKDLGSGFENLAFSSTVTLQQIEATKDSPTWSIIPGSFHHFLPPASASSDIKARFREVPIVAHHTIKTGFFRGRLAMSNLADMQLTHWRKSNEKDNALSIAAVPAKFFRGFTKEQVESIPWGPWMVVFNADKEGNVAIEDIAHSLNSMEMAQDDLTLLQAAMAVVALEPSVSRASGEEKATIRQIEEARQLTRKEAWLSTWLQSFFEAWEWTAAYLNITLPENACVSCNQEVFDALRGNQGFDLVIDVVEALSESTSSAIDELVLKEAKRHALISDNIDIDALVTRIAAERAESVA